MDFRLIPARQKTAPSTVQLCARCRALRCVCAQHPPTKVEHSVKAECSPNTSAYRPRVRPTVRVVDSPRADRAMADRIARERLGLPSLAEATREREALEALADAWIAQGSDPTKAPKAVKVPKGEETVTAFTRSGDSVAIAESTAVALLLSGEFVRAVYQDGETITRDSLLREMPAPRHADPMTYRPAGQVMRDMSCQSLAGRGKNDRAYFSRG